jgi:hypothetical protein
MALVSFGFCFNVLIALAVGSTSNVILLALSLALHFFHDWQCARSDADHEPAAFPRDLFSMDKGVRVLGFGYYGDRRSLVRRVRLSGGDGLRSG